MQNTSTPPQDEKTEAVQLTAGEKNIIILALGALSGLSMDNEHRELSPMGREALRVAQNLA